MEANEWVYDRDVMTSCELRYHPHTRCMKVSGDLLCLDCGTNLGACPFHLHFAEEEAAADKVYRQASMSARERRKERAR
jgi:hypothetical protein